MTVLSRRSALALASSAALAPLIGCRRSSGPSAPAPAPANTADADFARIAKTWMDASAKATPSGATALGGRIPLNTSGGLECKGHPVGATGLAQVTEIVEQLRGDAGRRQVEGARVGLTQNGGGVIAPEEASMAVHILAVQS